MEACSPLLLDRTPKCVTPGFSLSTGTLNSCRGTEMKFTLVRTEYDRNTHRAYIELRTCDLDGGDAIATAIFSIRTTAGLSRKQLEEDGLALEIPVDWTAQRKLLGFHAR